MNFLDQKILGEGLPDWLLAGAVTIATLLVLRAVLHVANSRLSRAAARTATHWDDVAVNIIARTTWPFLLLLAIYAGSLFLELPDRAVRLAQHVLIAGILLQAGVWGSTLLSSLLDSYRKRTLREDPAAATTVGMLGFLGRIVLWSIIVLIALDNLGVNVTALVAGLGIGGVAIALAIQNVLGDIFASLSIVLDKPFVIGDFLVIDDHMGSVEYVGLKTTRIRSLSGEQLVFSNSDLLGSRIRNFGRMFKRRVVFKLGVTYDTPREKLARIPEIIQDAVQELDKSRFDRSHFMNFGNYSLDFETVFYVLSADYNTYMDVQQALFFRIHEAFESEGIEFAYPTQTLHVSRAPT